MVFGKKLKINFGNYLNLFKLFKNEFLKENKD